MKNRRTHAGRAAGALVLAVAALAAVGSGACSRGPAKEEAVHMTAWNDVPAPARAALAGRRIFFGHQSIGGNIVDAMGPLLREQPAPGFRVVSGDSAPDGGPAFAHAMIGRNGDPVLKTNDFAGRIEGGLGNHVDIALHKYCFVDLVPGTKVDSVFEHYRSTMARLHAEYPRVVFVHVTTPLVTARAGGLKLLAQRLLGRAPTRVAANLVRERFNERMRREYAGREPLFDLAALESVRPDGSREAVAFGGQPGYALFPGYASEDGSHLNEAGSRLAAQALLAFLAELPATAGQDSARR